LLLLIDAPYHVAAVRKYPGFMVLQLVIVLLGAVPLIRFLYSQPLGILQQLAILRSGVASAEPLSVVLGSALMRYSAAFDPVYWFNYSYIPGQIRHLWKARPFLSTFSALPFVLGLMVTVCTFWTVRSRVLLVFLLCGALPVTMVETHVQRMFYMVAPAIVIMTIGVNFCYHYCRHRAVKTALQVSMLLLLAFQTRDLTKEFLGAGTWYDDYTLGGLQWGAKALFAEAIPKVLSEYPQATITPSGEWANGADIFPLFFLNSEQRARIRGVPFDLFHPESDQVIPKDRIFILSPPERLRITESGKFKTIKPILEVPYPDGTLGFTFSQLEYVDTIEEVMAPERMARLVPQQASIVAWGTNADITFSRLDMGDITEVFDSNFFTLARGVVANPFVIEMIFKEPRHGLGIKLDLFPMDSGARISVKDSQGNVVGEASGVVMNQGLDKDTTIELRFPNGPVSFSSMVVEVQSLADLPNRAHIHIREMALLS
jgi:hypothetical protein